MKIVYHAENIIDANLVKSILENAGFRAFINGEYLAGAMGELPAGGLMQIAVADNDEPGASVVVAQFERERQEITAESQEDSAPDEGGLPAT